MNYSNTQVFGSIAATLRISNSATALHFLTGLFVKNAMSSIFFYLLMRKLEYGLNSKITSWEYIFFWRMLMQFFDSLSVLISLHSNFVIGRQSRWLHTLYVGLMGLSWISIWSSIGGFLDGNGVAMRSIKTRLVVPLVAGCLVSMSRLAQRRGGQDELALLKDQTGAFLLFVYLTRFDSVHRTSWSVVWMSVLVVFLLGFIALTLLLSSPEPQLSWVNLYKLGYFLVPMLAIGWLLFVVSSNLDSFEAQIFEQIPKTYPLQNTREVIVQIPGVWVGVYPVVLFTIAVAVACLACVAIAVLWPRHFVEVVNRLQQAHAEHQQNVVPLTYSAPKFLTQTSVNVYERTEPPSNRLPVWLYYMFGGAGFSTLSRELIAKIDEENEVIYKLEAGMNCGLEEAAEAGCCLICMENACDGVLMECGHSGVCFQCGSSLWQRHMTCPLCRANITACHRILITSFDPNNFSNNNRIVEVVQTAT
eukprot:Platyproteum_vivax@DN8191_c0_g1_i1.p1